VALRYARMNLRSTSGRSPDHPIRGHQGEGISLESIIEPGKDLQLLARSTERLSKRGTLGIQLTMPATLPDANIGASAGGSTFTNSTRAGSTEFCCSTSGQITLG